jgi:hypothetical protein
MAGEMNEKLGKFEKAGDNYRHAGLIRKAAEYVPVATAEF